MSQHLQLSKYSDKLQNKYKWLYRSAITISSLFLFSPISWFFLQGYFTSILIGKLTCAIGSLGFGWSLTKNIKDTDIFNDENIWILIYEKIEIAKCKETNLDNNKIIEIINDPDTEIGSLYQFIVLILIEKYNKLKEENIDIEENNNHILEELKIVTKLLTIKHPYYPDCFNYDTIYQSIHKNILHDLDNYIKFYYLLTQQNATKNLYLSLFNIPKSKVIWFFIESHPDLDLNIDEIYGILGKTSKQLKDYISHKEIDKKSKILKSTLLVINNEYREIKGRELSCDDLLPILTLVVIYNWEMIPPSEIAHYYHYQQDNIGEFGYIGTIIQNASQLSDDLLKKLKPVKKITI